MKRALPPFPDIRNLTHAHDQTADLAADECDSVVAAGADHLPAVAADHRAKLQCRLRHSPADAVGLSFAFAFAQLAVGPLSDSMGRRPVLLASLIVFTIGSICCALSPTIEILIASRLIQACGACGGVGCWAAPSCVTAAPA